MRCRGWQTTGEKQRQTLMEERQCRAEGTKITSDEFIGCCNELLRRFPQVGSGRKMFINKLSILILLISVRNGSHALLQFALRRLVPEVRDRLGQILDTLANTLVDGRSSLVSFIRVGDLPKSKSKLVKDFLSLNSFNTFFHRECPNGSVKRSVSNGSIEAAWFQSPTATEDEFNSKFFTAINLREDTRNYPKANSICLPVINADCLYGRFV